MAANASITTFLIVLAKDLFSLMVLVSVRLVIMVLNVNTLMQSLAKVTVMLCLMGNAHVHQALMALRVNSQTQLTANHMVVLNLMEIALVTLSGLVLIVLSQTIRLVPAVAMHSMMGHVFVSKLLLEMCANIRTL
jgi:hypothetical protein